MQKQPRIVALWGAHRLPPQRDGSSPTSIDKGIREISELGFDVLSIYPREDRRALPTFVRKILKGKALYKASTLTLLRTLRETDVIYTSDNAWCHTLSRLKSIGMIKNKLVFKWAGFDANFANILNTAKSKESVYFHHLLVGTDAVFFASTRQEELVRQAYPDQAHKLTFWPTAIDVDFYRNVLDAAGPTQPYFVAVGSDTKRDWQLIISLARRRIPLRMVTDDERAKALYESVYEELAGTLQLDFGVGFKRSAEIMAESSGIVIATLPNQRFSGSTTVGVAACLRKPLILDEEYDLSAYGLVPGVNCEWFRRSDVESAVKGIQSIRDDREHAAKLAHAIYQLRNTFGTKSAADVLRKAFVEEELPAPFAPSS